MLGLIGENEPRGVGAGMIFTVGICLEIFMSRMVALKLEVSNDLAKFRLPLGVHARLQDLLDRQDDGKSLWPAVREEAQGLVNFAELFSLLRLMAGRISGRCAKKS